MFYKKPPVIVHWHKPEGFFMEMAQDACKNVRLSKRATKLFLYYAGCKSGFRPATAKISAETGIGITNVPHARDNLIAYGFIGYGGQFDNSVVIDWSHIRAFAILQEPLRYVKGRMAAYFKPIQPPKEKKRNTYRIKKTIGELGEKYIIKCPRQYTAEEAKLYDFLDSLTEEQYSNLVHAFAPSVVLGGKMMSDREHKQYFQERSGYDYDDSWMHTPEYIEKMRRDVVFLKNQPQELPF